ncbi:MAG: hypothetical protein FWE19_04275 [Oscillospiraceae bacterium]|nr:hypothetical protein [Oscillospiraceae bacterium]
MLTFEESREALTQIADALPDKIFEELNGGVLLLPDTITDEHDLLILGQYHVDPFGFGRYVTIHYGSMEQAYGHLSHEAFRQKLDDVLRHELLHHIESLADDRSLEIKDAMQVERYLRFRRKRPRN